MADSEDPRFHVSSTSYGFRVVAHPVYSSSIGCESDVARLIQEDSAIGDCDYNIPGSSYLWVGSKHRLDREEVRELVGLMSHWLEHKRLPLEGE